MIILGIDPGLTRTGYAVVRSGGPPTALAVGVISTDPGSDTPVRLAELFADLSSLIADHRPDVLAIERVFTNRNLQTAISVGRASGVCLLAGAQAGVPVYEHSPTAVKLAVTGDGRATKAMVQKMVTKRLGLDVTPKPADAADALAIALCQIQTMRVVAT